MTIDPDDPMWFPSGENPPLEAGALIIGQPAECPEIPDTPEQRAYLKGWNNCMAGIDKWEVIDDPLIGVPSDHVNEIPKNEHVPPLVLTGDPMIDRLRARGMHPEAAEIERLRSQLADARTILNTAPAQTWVQALRNKLEE